MNAALEDEIGARVEAMAVTGDIPEHERRRAALEDILELSTDDIGCYSDAERLAWNRIRSAARKALAETVEPK
jgi:hypothetical protein